MRCNQCGATIGPTEMSCSTCGTAASVSSPAPPPPPGDSFAPVDGPPSTPPPTDAWTAAPTAPAPSAPPTYPAPPIAPVPPAPPTHNPWAVPPPGTEWGVPQDPNHPAYQTPAQPYGYPAPPRAQPVGVGYSIGGIICGVVALVFCPLVLGIIGLVLSGKARSRGESLAGVAMAVSIVGLVGGMLLGAFIATRL